MAIDVQEITGTTAIAAARLSDFSTGGAVPLPAHTAWLDSKVKPLISGNPSAWVDLLGHASRQWKHTGGMNSHQLNRILSFQRCEALKARIAGYGSSVRFNVEFPRATISRSCRTRTTATIGPPTPFTTTRSADLRMCNSTASLYQDAGATFGSYSVSGTMRLTIKEIVDFFGLIGTHPSTIPMSGGWGVQMPGLGSASEGVLALVSGILPLISY